ncbi:glycosyltransferase family 2 protein [Candidatus Woesearchaeota archaeon]|nr:glycosyltransferase family 2 protein [Candidatus Woesearchaeota archaeon]
MKEHTFVILPAFNEEKYIAKVVKKCLKYCSNVVVVDDGSFDLTYREAENAGASCISHIINLGKGAAMKTGAEYAIKKGAKKIIFLDSDDQHDCSQIPEFSKQLDNFDVVFGYRDTSNVPAYRNMANNLGLFLVRTLFFIPIRDVSNGFRAMTADAYRKIKWNSNDYSVEVEMVVNAAVRKVTFTQVKTKIKYHDKYKGINISDAVGTALKLFLWRLVK